MGHDDLELMMVSQRGLFAKKLLLAPPPTEYSKAPPGKLEGLDLEAAPRFVRLPVSLPIYPSVANSSCSKPHVPLSKGSESGPSSVLPYQQEKT